MTIPACQLFVCLISSGDRSAARTNYPKTLTKMEETIASMPLATGMFKPTDPDRRGRR